MGGVTARLFAAPHGHEIENPSLAGKPVLGMNASGVLEVFDVNSEGALRHRWQKAANGDWSSWSVLGNNVLPGIAIANYADGRMAVFAVDRTNNALLCMVQRETNSLQWSKWISLGGLVRPPLAVAQNSHGRLEVFAVDAANSSVQHIWQTNSNGEWSSWSNLGGSLNPGLVAARNQDGRLEIFGIQAGEVELVHNWQRTEGTTTNWSGWMPLGGSIKPGFVVGQNIAGRLEVFAVNRDTSAVVRICQVTGGDSEHWTPWLDFGSGDQTKEPPATRDFVPDWQAFGSNVESGLALGTSRDGRIEIFGVNAKDGSVLHRWENRVDGSDIWSQWSSMRERALSYPAVGRNEEGNLEVFVVDRNDKRTIRHRRQISLASDWLDWHSLDQQTLQYRSRAWRVDEGLPDNLVQAINQTRDGFLWVGTRQGLARFDGVEFVVFNAQNTPALRNSSVTTLCADHQGTLWIGTDGGGLARLTGGFFARYEQADGLAGNNVRTICETKDGAIWIGTDTGMSRYKDGKFENYTTKDGLLSPNITYISEDRDGNLWIATAKGLNRLQPDGRMGSFTMPNRLPNDTVRGICQDQGGRIWVGSNNGLLWYNWFWGQSFYAYNTRYGISDPFVSAICEDREGTLWVGTYSGLNRFSEGRFYSQHDNEGLPFDRVNALFGDREGNLWVGTKEGLARLSPNRFSVLTRQQGLSHNNVTSVLQDKSGSLWIGTWGGGLDQLREEKVTVHSSTNNLSQDLILSLCEGRDGSIWAGADFDGGLLHLKDGKMTRFAPREGLTNSGLRVLHEDSKGSLWIGTDHGLYCLRNSSLTNYTIRDHLAGNVVRAICEDHAGKLWIGTDGGLSYLQGGQFYNFTLSNGLSDSRILAVFEDRENSLWVGTAGGGLNRFRNGRFTAYSTREGLFSDEVFSIRDDAVGWLWMSCSKGVFRVQKKDLDAFEAGTIKVISCAAYDKTDGMESAQCNGIGKPASWQTPDGHLWFPTSKGVITVDPQTMPENQLPPPVYIGQVLADRTPQIGVLGQLAMDVNTLGEKVVRRVPPGRGELEFRYSALNLAAPEKSRFRYKLVGSDPDWVDAGTRRTAYYNNLAPGRYDFRVIACNKDGVWNQTGASLGVVLLPHYWQTWWFRGLLIFLVVGGASGAALYVTRRRMQRKLNVLKQRHAIENERGRIAKDIHDDLGSSLTRILMLGERAEEGLERKENVEAQIKKIVASARQTVQALDEIVWAVNPESDTLDGLVGYIAHYADEFFESAGVFCRLEIPVELPAIELSAELRHNLFLVVKEAFNNVVKHSRATTVNVQVSATPSVVQIVVEDDGCGFDHNKAATGQSRSGIANMRRRMKHLGGEFQINSRPGEGTRFMFTARLEPPRNPA